MRTDREARRRAHPSQPPERGGATDSSSSSLSGFESRPLSPRRSRSRSSKLSPSATLYDSATATFVSEELITDLEGLRISSNSSYDPNPRSFPHSVKQQCWEKAEKVKGRDPACWRKDPLGNIVFRKLVGCPGCLCHDYDHIVPYSKGGKSTLENCQVLQVVIWISLNYQHMATCAMLKTLEDVVFNELFVCLSSLLF
ncbi:hypothetical protein Ancab_038875 [Ancistrocladus abbreviatus]